MHRSAHQAELRFQSAAQEVAQQYVRLLYARGCRGGHHNKMIGERSDVAAVASAQRRRHQPHRLRLAQRLENIRTLSRGGNGNGHIIGLADGFDLAGKNLFEAEIVTAGGERRAVGGQRSATIARRFSR